MTLHRRGFIAGLISCPICAGLARADDSAPHWTYEGAGDPAEWGKLDKTFEACSIGSEQSPLDLRDPISANVGALRIKWAPEAFAIANDGHTIQADVTGKSSLSEGAETYELKQFHFHTPSEHAIDGKRTAMEAHFVHAHSSGKLLVVGVFLTPGEKHRQFAQIIAAAPKTEGEAKLAAPLDINSFLPPPKLRARYRYEGSLTTPPCSEVVDWNVFAHPVQVAAADIEAFKQLYPMNARPLQSANRRFLLKG